MTEERLRQILADIRGVRTAALGDVCLDAYWHADMQRAELSRETPYYNRPVYRETYSGGGLANVVANLCALGVAGVSVFSVIGEDWRGRVLSETLENIGADVAGLKIEKGRFTPMYLKPILEGYQSSSEAERFDFVTSGPPAEATISAVIRDLGSTIGEYDCVLLGDQTENGILTEELIAYLVETAGTWNIQFSADSRNRIEQFKGMVWKPNEIEAARALGMNGEADPAIMAEKLYSQGGFSVFLTIGGDGCVVADGSPARQVPAFTAPGPIDFVGAGDSFHSAMAASLAAGADAEEAAVLGNLAASVTVRKIGTTGTAAPAEILEVFKNRNREVYT